VLPDEEVRESRAVRAVRPVHDDRGSILVLAVSHRQRGRLARGYGDAVGPEPDYVLGFERLTSESDGLDELP
jgi:hypothetical protein